MVEKFGKKQWVELFRQTGLTDEMMEKWHHLFENGYPEAHQSFLEWLQLSSEEVAAIRTRFS